MLEFMQVSNSPPPAKLCRAKVGELYWITVTPHVIVPDPCNNMAFHAPHMLLADLTAGTATLLKSGDPPGRNNACTVRRSRKRAEQPTSPFLQDLESFLLFSNIIFVLQAWYLRWVKGGGHWEPRTSKLIDVMLNTSGFAKKTPFVLCSVTAEHGEKSDASIWQIPTPKCPSHLLPICEVKQPYPHS